MTLAKSFKELVARRSADDPAFAENLLCESMRKKERIARHVEDLDNDTLKAIAQSEVSPEHTPLNNLLEDWTP